MSTYFYSGECLGIKKLKKRGEGDQGSSKKKLSVKAWGTEQ